MARNITVNGVAYPVPTAGDVDWAKNLTDFHQAVADGIEAAGQSGVIPALHGAVGDGVTDDSAALQAAIDAAAESKLPLVLSNKTYLINTELVVDATTVEIRGRSQNSILRAGASIRSVFAVTGGSQIRAYDCFFDGGRLAQYAVFCHDASGSYFDNCDFYEGLIDGLHLDADCDRVRTANCRYQLNGRLYHTAGYAGASPAIIRTSVAGTTVRITAGRIDFTGQVGTYVVGETITGSSSGATAVILGQYDAGTTGRLALGSITGTFTNLDTLTGGTSGATATVTADSYSATRNCIVGAGTTFTGKEMRAGDWVSVHATAPGDASATWLQVESVDSATFISCCLHPQVAATGTGQQYSLHVGDGLHEGPGRADVNIGIHIAPEFRNNAGCGYLVHGLYGPLVMKPQSDSNGAWPICISYVNLATIGTQILGEYYEGNNAGDHLYDGCAADVLVLGSNSTGAPGESSGSFNWGLILGRQNAGDEGRLDPIGSAPKSYVPSMVLGANAWAKGRIAGLNYFQNAVSSVSGLTMNDFNSAAWAAVSGVEALGADPAACAYDFKSDAAITNHEAGTDYANLLTKFIARWRNSTTPVAAIGVDGDFRTRSTDSSGTPGAATIHRPSGRSAIASGAASVVITNGLCVAGTKVGFSLLTDDGASVRFWMTPAAGQFTFSRDATPAVALSFDWWLINTV